MATTSSSLTTLVEAGFELWPFYTSRLIIYHNFSISVWRYIFQHKPARSIGRGLTSIMGRCITSTEDAEVVDFLVTRLAEEFFQLETPDSEYNRWFAEYTILAAVDEWLGSLFRLWFYGQEKSTSFLFEYKLSLILRQLLMPSYSRESNKKLLLRTITGIYIKGVVNIIKACLWSVEVTNATFQIWSKPFLELGIDLFSHHAFIIRGNGDHGYEEDSDGGNSDGEDGDNERTAHPILRFHTIDCCRDTYLEIIHEDHRDNLSLNVTSHTRPEYSHLDPQFTCEAGRMRSDLTGAGRCLSRIDEAFIKDGKFSMDMPGKWEEPLVPNTAMELALYLSFYGRPQIFYSMIHNSRFGYYTIGYYTITEEDVQRVQEDFRNGTLYGLSEDLPETSGED